LTIPCMTAQQAIAPKIEVTSVKMNTSYRASAGNRFDPQRMSWTNVSLRQLVEAAYSVQDYQLAGGPSWMDADRWDIAATTNIPTKSSEKFKLLQSLLADRFHLIIQREIRNLPLYRLVIGKGGTKLSEAKPGQTDPAQRGTTVGRGSISAKQTSMSTFVYFLSGELRQPIVDDTGLKGEYDFDLTWSPTEMPDAKSEAAEQVASSVFAAVQEQLGLRLQPSRGPVEVLVVASVQKPSAN